MGLGIRETALAEEVAKEIADDASLLQDVGVGRRRGCRSSDNCRCPEGQERTEKISVVLINTLELPGKAFKLV
ncbi:MAG: hypothetical protein AUG51_00005 [Acidobacteria bacterium 13_1_20CM_3_53_8]|nr:MAG: hypothetical protein AUG51_00005 [Acidobacteria bacterium 13_1_20CM_3_53_8]